MSIQVSPAVSAADLDEVRSLVRGFVVWHRERNIDDIDLIDAYFDEAFERELRDLPGEYAPPGGELLLASDGGEAIGCVAFRRVDSDTCEMKRMFVRTDAHGRGAGRALASELIERARGAGYRWMRLDTSRRQLEAISLYRSLGFVAERPPADLDDRHRDWLVFYRLDLRSDA